LEEEVCQYTYNKNIMKPELNKKEIKKAKYKYAWYKSFIKLLRNQRVKDFKNDKTIHLS
jgi:hypothetical protein